MAREVLRSARKEAGLTQQDIADKLGVSWRTYQRIESGKILGKIWVWDSLEDLLGINQRKLREITPKDSQS